MNVTQWFGGDEKPVHIGSYERDVSDCPLAFCFSPSLRWFSYWNGKSWGVIDKTPASAAEVSGVSEYQSLPWRGVAR